MKPESDPVSPDEMLIRLVFRDRFTARVPTISPNAFEPRVKGDNPDKNGISLFRKDCLADPADALAVIAPDKRPLTGIVLIPYQVLAGLGLSTTPDPVGAVPGHVVIPQLNAADYTANKSAFAPIKLALAQAASENIFRRPSPDPPT